MEELLELAMQKIADLERKIEKYFQILKVENELDFILKGGYLLEDELEDIIDGTYSMEGDDE